MHQLDRRRGEAVPLLLDLLRDRQQLLQLERRAHGADPRPVRPGAGDVIEQVVQEVDRRRLGVTLLALLVQALELAVGNAKQALDRRTAVDATVKQALDQRADDPPQLEYGLARGDVLDALGDHREHLEILGQTLVAQEAQQAKLEPRPQAARPLDYRQRGLARLQRRRFRLPVGAQVEKKQRAFGQQR